MVRLLGRVLIILKFDISLLLVHAIHLVDKVHKLFVDNGQDYALILKAKAIKPFFGIF